MRDKILVTIVVCVVLAGCATRQTTTEERYSKTPVVQTQPGPEVFANSVWRQQIENGKPPVYYVELRADGKLGYNKNSPNSFAYDGTDVWRIEEGRLLLIWTNGFNTDTFPLGTGRPVTLTGTQSVGSKRVVMERLR